MAEDLGAWPPEQATVLLEALKKAGLSPQAKRTREGIAVSVPDDQADEAQRQLVANMDAIARAARTEPTPLKRPQRRKRPTSGSYGKRVSDPDRAPLTSERLIRIGRPTILVLIGLLIAAIIPQLRLFVIALTVAAIVYLVGKQAQRDRGDGP